MSPATRLTAVQQKKLRGLLVDAMSNVPLYKRLYGDHGLTLRDMADPDILGRLPILTKDHLRDTPLELRRNGRFGNGRLPVESTTGSTGQPVTICMDRKYRRKRNLRFVGALMNAGYRPWQRLMLLTDRYSAAVTHKGRRTYVSVEQSVDGILNAYRAFRPDFLYGFTTPLRLLAECLEAEDAAAARPRAVVSTAETLEPGASQYLQAAFGCPVHDFYGLTEMGLVAWKASGAPHYTAFPNAVLIEFLASGHGQSVKRMLMTNLYLRATPVIRFDSGDLASLVPGDIEPRIARFDGRVIDAIVRRDGSRVSPYRLTDALRDVGGLRRFKIVQHTLERFSVGLELETATQEATRAVENRLRRVLGSEVRLEIAVHQTLCADGARKFRPVESRVGRT